MAKLIRRMLLATSLAISFAYSLIMDKEISRVVDGTVTTAGEIPAMAALLKDKHHICGGALINEYCFLTAAHCFNEPNSPSRYQFLVGAHNKNIFAEEQYAKTYIVMKIMVHPKYSYDTLINDLAIACTNESIDYNEFVQPTVLSNGLSLDDCPEATVYGWGKTFYGSEHTSDFLMKANFPRVSHYKCKSLYNDTKYTIQEGHVCFGLDGGQSSCHGDSGGPLVCNTGSNNGTQIGIVSFGKECSQATYPGVYTKVSYFFDWIEQTKKEYIVSLK